jgi:hypothetical protein
MNPFHAPTSTIKNVSNFPGWDRPKHAKPRSRPALSQIHAINALNIILAYTPPLDLAAAPFLADRCLLQEAIALLSVEPSALRSHTKALLTVALLLRLGPDWLADAVEADLAQRYMPPPQSASDAGELDLRDYAAACQGALEGAVADAVPGALQEVFLYSFGLYLPSFASFSLSS